MPSKAERKYARRMQEEQEARVLRGENPREVYPDPIIDEGSYMRNPVPEPKMDPGPELKMSDRHRAAYDAILNGLDSGDFSFMGNFRDQYFGSFADSPTGRIRPRDDRRGDFGDDRIHLAPDHVREMHHAQQKMEEGDMESRHHVPPDMRLNRLMSRYNGPDVLQLLFRILEEQGDIENILDILEPEMEMRYSRKEMDRDRGYWKV